MEAIAFAAIGNMCVLQVQKHKRSAEEVQALAYEVIDGIKPFEQNLKLFVSTLIERINAMWTDFATWHKNFVYIILGFIF